MCLCPERGIDTTPTMHQHTPVSISGTIRLSSIDPGSNHCGVARYSVDAHTREIISCSARTIRVDSLKNDTGLLEDYTSPLVMKYYKLRNEILREFKDHDTTHVAYEGPFSNYMSPGAFGPLVSVMTMVRDAAHCHQPFMPFMVFQPTLVKKSVNKANSRDKDDMLEALKGLTIITGVLETDIDSLDNNGVDALLVGYTYYRTQILGNLMN